MNTLCRTYFHRPPPFLEVSSPIHCHGRHKKRLQIPLAQQLSAAPALLSCLPFDFPLPSQAGDGRGEAVTTGLGGERDRTAGRSSGLNRHPRLPLGRVRLPAPRLGKLLRAERGGAARKGRRKGRASAGGGAVTPLVPCPGSHVPVPWPITGRRCPGSEEAVVRDGPRPEMFSSLASAALVVVAVVTKTTSATAAPRHSFRG